MIKYRMLQFLKRAKRIATACATLAAIFGHLPANATAGPPGLTATTFPGISPFGIGSDHENGVSIRALSKWIPQMEAIGIHQLRYCNPKEFSYLAGHQIVPGGLLYGIPPGDTQDAPGTLPVHNLRAWSNYVTRTVTQMHGRIKYWEVWNEPPNGTGRHQTAADYARILISAYRAAKKVYPNCKIGMAAKSVDINYLQQVIAAGGKNHFDYITLHPYEVLANAITNNEDSVYMHIIPTVRKMLRAVDPSRAGVPIWFTEVGYNAHPDPAIQARALVQAYTMGIAEGATCINWFEGMDGDSGPMGLLTRKGNRRPAYTAMAQLIRYLGQHPVYLGWVPLSAHNNGFVFQGARYTVLSAWAQNRAASRLSFDSTVEIVHPLTGHVTRATSCRLTQSPILIIGVPGGLVKLAIADKFKQFPWNGNFTHARTVSVSLGKAIIQKGLHLVAARALIKQTAAYGGSARSGNVPGGITFEVDPNFLSYTREPIEITALVRRAAPSQPAAIVLHYESPASWGWADKNAGACNIPAGGGWHTVKWKMTDDQFVSCWAYNFNITSGPYFIKKVTVTKLAG